jgi:16S rRNA (cytosine967-C5)-methyltransferase
MAGRKTKSARTVAIDVLNRCEPGREYAASVLNKHLGETDQRQRATDLVLGTIRNRTAIDTVITAFSGRAVDRISRRLLNILRVGVCELVYSPETAQYSIVNEAVENAKTLAGRKQVGFVNAVLRQITRHISERAADLSKSDPGRTLCRSVETGCEFDRDFLPDPESSPADYLSIVFSLPEWLISDWLGELGMESTRRICFASNRRPSIYLRANSLKTTVQELAQMLRAGDIETDIVPNDSMIRVRSPRMITELPGFADGLFIVQDITASRVVRMLNPRPDWRILDLCSAPGVKATQLAELTSDSAAITATDIDAQRLEKVKENAARLDIRSIKAVPCDEVQNLKFDCIVLDVPCSNTGVLARRVEARHRLTADAIKKFVKIQSELLNTAVSMLRPNGIICYSTCSIQKEENNNLIKHFLTDNSGFVLDTETLTLPSAQDFDCDGGYYAILTGK